MRNLSGRRRALPVCRKDPQPRVLSIESGRLERAGSLLLLLIILAIPYTWTISPNQTNPELSEPFSQTYGKEETDDNAQALVQTADGGFALAGITWSYGAGNNDMWLVKTNADGVIQWHQTYGGPARDRARALIQTADGGFALAGDTWSYGAGNNDMWLVKTDANGVMQWNQTYGGVKEDGACALVQTADSGFALAGRTSSYGAGNNDMWLVKIDANGVLQWSQTYGGAADDVVSALVQTIDGGFALAGDTSSYGAGNNDLWLIKIDANGAVQWDQTYGGSERDWASALVQTADEGFAIAGSTSSNSVGYRDMWLVKTNANGVAQWAEVYGGSGREEAEALILTADGGFALAGFTTGIDWVDFVDMLLVKTDAYGVVQWQRTYGGTLHDVASALVQTVDGGFALAGITAASWFLPYYGGGDMWLLKTDVVGGTFSTESYQSPESEPLPFATAFAALTSQYELKTETKI